MLTSLFRQTVTYGIGKTLKKRYDSQNYFRKYYFSVICMNDSNNDTPGKNTASNNSDTRADENKPALDNKTVIKPSARRTKAVSGKENADGKIADAESTDSKNTGSKNATPNKTVSEAADNKTRIKRRPKATPRKNKKADDAAATVIKPSIRAQRQQPTGQKTDKQNSDKPGSDKPEAEKIKSNIEQNENALTRIGQAIREQDSTAGFIDAQKAADLALADDKIIINKRFVLESTLGAGGMGTVYRARDLRKIEAGDLQPYVAVKVLNEDFKNHPDAFVSLQREASRSQVLSHPNNVTVHDFDREGDIYYMTMELLEGRGLEVIQRECKNKGLPVKEALPIISDYCKGLLHAHHKNIIHSDLKPGNIFVDDKGGAKVLDYGIARITNEANHPEDFDAGTLGALTPAYASLEMFNGDAPHASDDVYAAAIIAYELFSGKHPYDRLSADKANEQNLKPKRLTNLSRQQWAALEAGLQLTRKKRTQDLQEFLNGLTEKKKFPVFKVISAILLCCTVGIGYLMYFAPDKVSIQANETFKMAEDCFNKKDYECAREKSEAVLVLLPEHQKANQMHQKAAQKIKADKLLSHNQAIEQCIKSRDVNCARRALNRLQQFAPDSSEYSAAKETITLFRVNFKKQTTLSQANTCFENNDFRCAREKANQVLYTHSEDTEASQLIIRIDNAEATLSAASLKLEQDYALAIKTAEQCQQKKTYRCAITHADKALKLKPGDSVAQNIKQQTQIAEQQHKSNLNNAINMVNIGKECLNKVKYRCAIASAESALTFIPNYSAALALQRKAKQAQQDVMKQNWNLK